jgi:hypothetical protein
MLRQRYVQMSAIAQLKLLFSLTQNIFQNRALLENQFV